MGAVADGAEAVERGDAGGGSEISVGAAADGAFAEREIHLRGERFGTGEERGGHFVFEGRAVEAAGDFEASAGMNRAERMQAAFQIAHVGNAEGAQVKDGACAFGDDVSARAAFDETGVDGDAAAEIVPFFEARELVRQFVNGVDALLGSEAGVRGAAVNDELGFADCFARRFQQAARAEGGLEDEDRVAAARFGFEEFAGRFAADFFVGGPQENEPLAEGGFCFAKGLQGEKRLNDAGLHVERSWAVGFASGETERHLLKRAGGVDGVVMAQDEELARRARFAGPVGDTQLIAAMHLREAFDLSAVLVPFSGDDAAAVIGRKFFQAGRFGDYEAAQNIEHLR